MSKPEDAIQGIGNYYHFPSYITNYLIFAFLSSGIKIPMNINRKIYKPVGELEATQICHKFTTKVALPVVSETLAMR